MDDLANKSKKTIYCQILFLESIKATNETTTRSKNVVDFLEIARGSIIYFDKSEDEIKSFEKSNPYVARLIKMDVNGECNIDWQDNDLKLDDYVKDYVRSDGNYDFSPILFIYQIKKQQRSNNNLCQKYSSQYGLMVYDQDSYLEMGDILEDFGYAIKRCSSDGWEKSLYMKKIYGNSLVIIDDFLLDDTKLFKDNLYEILDVLLPWDIVIPFYLTFICAKNNKDYSSRYKMIEEKIKELRPRYFHNGSSYNGLIKINIIDDSTNVFHDRVILTNYCWISCGSGFDLYNSSQQAKHSTNVSIIYPFIQHHARWAKDSYLNFLCDSRDVFVDAQKGKNEWYGVNLFTNRLYMIQSMAQYLT